MNADSIIPLQDRRYLHTSVTLSILKMKFVSAATLFATLSATSTYVDAFAFVTKSGTHARVSTSQLFSTTKRQPIMAGNWKMNPATEDEAISLAAGLTKLLGEETCPMDEENDFCTEVVVFPPHPFLRTVKDTVEEVGITVGSQSVFFEDKGAYTGSVAISMVESVGCEYVLCGHSERRTLFNDSDDAINRKVKKVLEAGLKPILCIGETKEEYDLKIKNEVCAMQLSKDLVGVTKEQMKDVVIAYEPVWAIGTGLVCGAEDASKFYCIYICVLFVNKKHFFNLYFFSLSFFLLTKTRRGTRFLTYNLVFPLRR